MKMLYPQEVEIFYLIPTIRKEFAVALKKQGKGQKEIASLLGITEAAVSQYIKEKRATKLKLSNKIKKDIEKSSKKIGGRLNILAETERILNLIKNKKGICKYHHKFAKIPKKCNVCFK